MADILRTPDVRRVLEDPVLVELLQHAEDASVSASASSSQSSKLPLPLDTIHSTLLGSIPLRKLLTNGELVQRIAKMHAVVSGGV